MRVEIFKLWQDKEEVTLTAYCMEKNEEIEGSEKRPAVIISPGGGYMGFTEREGESVALHFLAAGYQAFVLHYSILESAAFPNALYDLAKAMCFIHQNAERLCINEEKIIVCGFSAGGNLSATLGVMWDQSFLREKFQVSSEWLKPAAMVLGYPVTNLEFKSNGKASEFEKQMMQKCIQYLTGKENPQKEDFDQLNLINYVSKNTPPTFLFHLCGDPIVPVDNSLQFASRLAAMGVPFVMEIGEDTWHGVSSLRAEDANQAFFRTEYSDWFEKAICWLKKKLFLEDKRNEVFHGKK